MPKFSKNNKVLICFRPKIKDEEQLYDNPLIFRYVPVRRKKKTTKPKKKLTQLMIRFNRNIKASLRRSCINCGKIEKTHKKHICEVIENIPFLNSTMK